MENKINQIYRILLPGSYVRNTNSACVLERKGICSGMSDLMVDLCNMAGIEAYSVKGTLSANKGEKVPHQWVAVVIGNEIYYLDPTKDVALQKSHPLYTKEQFYGRESHEYIPLFYHDY